MPFDDNEFLSESIETDTKPHLEPFSAWLQYSLELNMFVNHEKKVLQVANDDARKIVAAALLLKMSNHYQSVISLLKRGLPVEAQIILRSMIQVLIHLRLLQKDERYIDTLIVSERAEQLKLLNVYTEPANNDIFTPSNVHFETKKQLKKELNGFRKDKIECLADEEYMDIQGGELMSFHLGYDFHEYPRIFYTSNNLLLSAADFIHDIFKDTFDEKRSLEFTEKLKYYHDKFVKLSGIDPDLAPND